METNRRFDHLQVQVGSIAARLEQLEDRLASAPSGQASAAGGSQPAREEVRIYDSDVRLPLGSDLVVSSPTGVMVSDQAQRTIVGDLTIESPAAVIQTTEAVVETTSGGAHIQAKTLSLAPKKSE